ncbi:MULTISPECIES: hypothetical protein [unclassified Curtobacterium]|uniref:hypothetical protein n=1 Tax=unclassified Curtobacterium TaxID=257496 RepID=UPI00188C6136|nr:MULTISPECIES: hypothetical protein [unclassified Curtobacterium]MBF4592110.1 hypothetical protein [Curtobacterium sp. VKM Ac-1395]MCY1692897.1 hypothetical protein [Curtobacterium sp. SL109]
MNDTVQVTLNREDWEHIVRLVQRVVPATSQSLDDAYEWDEDEGPDVEWIEARQRSLADARALSDRVTAAVAVATGEAAPRQAGTAATGEA